MKELFFVYGTLKEGYGNHHYLNDDTVKPLGQFQTEPKFTMLSCGGFPAVMCEGDTTIQGELYETENPDVIRRVYGLEGFTGKKGAAGNWYDVEEIETPHGKASMFVFRKPSDSLRQKIVANGKW